MYHPSSACGAHVDLLSGLICTSTRMPGGAIGSLLKSYGPNSCDQAECFGLMRDPRMRLMVNTACGMSLSHKCMGNSASVVHNPAIKWFLNVRMARSAALVRCWPGAANWYLMSLVLKYIFIISEHSLSSMCSCGPRPLRRRISCNFLVAAKIVVAFRFPMGSASMALLS